MERLKEKKKNKMGKINDILMINKIRDWINQKILGKRIIRRNINNLLKDNFWLMDQINLSVSVSFF